MTLINPLLICLTNDSNKDSPWNNFASFGKLCLAFSQVFESTSKHNIFNAERH